MSVRKIAGTVMLIGGVLLFVVFNQKSKHYLVLSDSGSSMKTIELELNAEAGNNYFTKFCFLDEKNVSERISTSADIDMFFNDQQIYTKRYSSGSSDDSGGVKRVLDTDEICYAPNESGTLTIKGKLIKGDKWEVQVYKNICDHENKALPVALIVAVIGLALVLKADKRII